jgi:glutamate-ammonia-ligase adenylyltransferase
MKSPTWARAIKDCADPAQATHFRDLLMAGDAPPRLARASLEEARILCALFSGSQAMSALLVANSGWLSVLESGTLKFARREQGLRGEMQSLLEPLRAARDYAGALKQLRHFKQREMLRIAARDLARLGDVVEITQEISAVADVCLEGVWDVCHLQLSERHGLPYHQDAEGRWHRTAGAIIGLGKLGGQELNYSSDVDVMFLYSEEGAVFKEPPKNAPSKSRRTTGTGTKVATPPTRSTLNNHQFFNRLAEAVVAETTRMAPEGALYRIDLRLRPEGDTGPLSRSLAGFENYYAQWGQTWERMMLIKARRVAGDESLAAEFLEMIQHFRYPRSINQGVLREVALMKDRIENEVVKAGELDRNVKLGRGGIREIEFVCQALQLLHGGRQPFLQGAQTLPALDKLVQYELLPAADAQLLDAAYRFLRDVEHRLQMQDNRQTHTIPTERAAQERLARLMGFATAKQFDKARQAHTTSVQRIFQQVLKAEVPEVQRATPFPTQFDGAETEWNELLAGHGFRDPDKALRMLREFVEGPGYVHVSPRTRELAMQLLQRLFRLCPVTGAETDKSGSSRRRLRPEYVLSDPDRVLTRLDSFIAAYGARATMFEFWNSNPSIFDLLVRLFDRSEFLAELAIRTPDLVDELVISGRLKQRKSAEETLRDLRHGFDDADQHLWLRRYHQAELMRIGLRDILGLADFEQYLAELSSLADACLQYALEVVMRRRKLRSAPFAIIGLGKLGGAEIDYGSDLDLIFVAGTKTKNAARLASLAVEVMDLVSRRTEQGLLFHTDARLRPDGEKGLLVNTIDAYETYYRQRAQLWELQTLTRTRGIAGDRQVGDQFQQLAGRLANFQKPSQPLAAYATDWKKKIHQMRLRIERERTPRGKDELAIKTGKGGLMDAEFIAQTICMEQGWQEANTLRALERGRDEGALPDAAELITAYRQLRRVEGILRRWSYEGETVLPDDPAPYYRVAVRCGFSASEDFRKALGEWRQAIRRVYLKAFEK